MSLQRQALALLLAAILFPALRAQEIPTGAFMQQFEQARIEDKILVMYDLIEKNPNATVQGFIGWEIQWCVASLAGEAGADSAERLQANMSQLGQLTKLRGPKSDYLNRRLQWLNALNDEAKQAKVDYDRGLGAALGDYRKAMQDRSEAQVRAATPKLHKLMELAETATDYFHAANMAVALGQMHSFIPDWFSTAYYYRRGVMHEEKAGFAADAVAGFRMGAGLKQAETAGRLRVELIDPMLPVAASKEKYEADFRKMQEEAIAGGGGEGGEGGNTAMEGMPDLPNIHPEDAEMGWVEWDGFKITKAKRRFVSPHYPDSLPWNYQHTVPLGDGAVVPAPFLPGNAQLEADGNKLLLYPQGKDKGSPQRIKLSPKPKTSMFPAKYPNGNVARLFFQLSSSPTSYSLNGHDFRLTGRGVRLLRTGESMVVGKLLGQPVEVHDLDANGNFDDYGIDCIVIGKGRAQKVMPLSKYITVEGRLHEFKLEADGSEMRTRAYDGPVAPLKVEYESAIMPEWLLASGTGGESSYVFNLMDGVETPMWVVPGMLQFYQGFITKGKGPRMECLIIQRSERNRGFEVKVGELNTWTLGGAGEGFTMACEATVRDGEIVIPGPSIKIYGAGGELYTQSLFGAVLPKVQIRKGKDGPVAMRGEFKPSSNADTSRSFDYVYSPSDFSERKTFSGPYAVKLTAKYGPLGKIESKWQTGSGQ